jgi:hypothetical protein
VQHNFPAQLFLTNPRQLLRNKRDFVIGCCDQDHTRREDLPRHSRAGLPCPNKPDGPARAGLAARNYRANLPSQFAQAATQRSSDAPSPDNGQTIWHLLLG